MQPWPCHCHCPDTGVRFINALPRCAMSLSFPDRRCPPCPSRRVGHPSLAPRFPAPPSALTVPLCPQRRWRRHPAQPQTAAAAPPATQHCRLVLHSAAACTCMRRVFRMCRLNRVTPDWLLLQQGRAKHGSPGPTPTPRHTTPHPPPPTPHPPSLPFASPIPAHTHPRSSRTPSKLAAFALCPTAAPPGSALARSTCSTRALCCAARCRGVAPCCSSAGDEANISGVGPPAAAPPPPAAKARMAATPAALSAAAARCRAVRPSAGSRPATSAPWSSSMHTSASTSASEPAASSRPARAVAMPSREEVGDGPPSSSSAVSPPSESNVLLPPSPGKRAIFRSGKPPWSGTVCVVCWAGRARATMR